MPLVKTACLQDLLHVHTAQLVGRSPSLPPTHAHHVHKPYRPLLGLVRQDVLKAHTAQLVDDAIVHAHLTALYDTLLEQNLVRSWGAARGLG